MAIRFTVDVAGIKMTDGPSPGTIALEAWNGNRSLPGGSPERSTVAIDAIADFAKQTCSRSGAA